MHVQLSIKVGSYLVAVVQFSRRKKTLWRWLSHFLVPITVCHWKFFEKFVYFIVYAESFQLVKFYIKATSDITNKNKLLENFKKPAGSFESIFGLLHLNTYRIFVLKNIEWISNHNKIMDIFYFIEIFGEKHRVASKFPLKTISDSFCLNFINHWYIFILWILFLSVCLLNILIILPDMTQ